MINYDKLFTFEKQLIRKKDIMSDKLQVKVLVKTSLQKKKETKFIEFCCLFCCQVISIIT